MLLPMSPSHTESRPVSARWCSNGTVKAIAAARSGSSHLWFIYIGPLKISCLQIMHTAGGKTLSLYCFLKQICDFVTEK